MTIVSTHLTRQAVTPLKHFLVPYSPSQGSSISELLHQYERPCSYVPLLWLPPPAARPYLSCSWAWWGSVWLPAHFADASFPLLSLHKSWRNLSFKSHSWEQTMWSLARMCWEFIKMERENKLSLPTDAPTSGGASPRPVPGVPPSCHPCSSLTLLEIHPPVQLCSNISSQAKFCLPRLHLPRPDSCSRHWLTMGRSVGFRWNRSLLQ